MRLVLATVAAAVLLSAPLPAQDNNPYSQKEKAAYDQVAKRLDPYGNLVAYLNTEEVAQGVVAFLKKLETEVLPQLMANDPAQAAQADTIVKVVNKLVADSGVAEIDGLGFSSVRLGEKLYRNKVFVHHPAAKNQGMLWKVLGKKPHALNWVAMLPDTTAVALFGDLDLAALWQWQFALVQATKNPQLIAPHQALVAQLTQQYQLDAVLNGFGGELGLILTLDPTNQVRLPRAQGELVFPEPGLALVFKVKDNALENFFTTQVFSPGGQALPFRELTVGTCKLRSYNLPVPLPFTVAPTLGTVDGYLILASSPKVIEQMLAAKGGTHALKSLPEYVQAAQGLPTTGNCFEYVSPRFQKALVAVQQQLMANLEEAKVAQLVQNLLLPTGDSFVCGVGQVLDDGILLQGNSSMSGATGVALNLVVAPGAIIAGMALPVLSKSREKARRVNCAGNLKQLGLGCLMYSGEHQGAFPPELAVLAEQEVLNAGKVYCCPSAADDQVPASAADLRAGKVGYVYVGAGLRDDDAEATRRIVAYDRPGNHDGKWLNLLFVDGHVEGVPARSIEDACQQKGWPLPKPQAK